jgi:4-amino-4-deoxy-L-arabinose transferase-like glycosyltransferase
LLMLLLVLAASLRLINLGYSDFQGDEVNALTRLKPQQSLFDFLLHQHKGPIQYLVTYGVSWFDPGFRHPALARLPFAFAGLLSVWIMYRLASLYFDKTIALYAAFLLATKAFLSLFLELSNTSPLLI